MYNNYELGEGSYYHHHLGLYFEELGLIKIDILSQRSLGVLRDTVESIKD